MANMFRCTLASGGALILTVTADSAFAGQTITCTDGTNTFTETCPSSSPYEVTFSSISIGTWTVSGEFEGVIYSEQIVISNFTLNLLAGFNYKQWVTLGGLDPTDYESLSEVFADEVAVRRLMTIHASADYLIEKVTDDVDAIDDFTANDTAMKWIGLRDYICDGLTAIAGVEAKFLASQYWERYLKDHVPTMTGNTAPYGEASFSGGTVSNPAYIAFNGDTINSCTAIGAQSLTYKFTNPVNVKRIKWIPYQADGSQTFKAHTVTFYGSNDNSTWTPLGSKEVAVTDKTNLLTLDIPSNTDYYLYYKATPNQANAGNYTVFCSLQYYGRELSVSVPVMTSNTAPFGEAIADSYYTSDYAPYKAFDNKNNSTDGRPWASVSSSGYYVGYKFNSLVNVKMVVITNRNDGTLNGSPTSFKVQGSVNGDWEDATETINRSTSSQGEKTIHSVDGNLCSDEFIVKILSTTNNASGCIGGLQFYGLDYSEREFETGSTKKWLYDHGVELETFTYGGNSSYKVIAENDGESIHLKSSNGAAGVLSAYAELANFDFSDYDLIRANVGDVLTTTSTASNGRCCSVIIYNQGTTTNSVASKAIEKGSSILPNNISLDVSSLNTSYDFYIIDSNNGAAESKVKELWLE